MGKWFNRYQSFERWSDENIWNGGHKNEKECPIQKRDWDKAEKRRAEVTEYRICELIFRGGGNLIVAIFLLSIKYTFKLIKSIFCPVILRKDA